MQPIDSARRGLARAGQQVNAAAARVAALPAAPDPARAALASPDPARSAPPPPLDPVDATLALGDGARLYRANLRVVAVADDTLRHTLDLFA